MKDRVQILTRLLDEAKEERKEAVYIYILYYICLLFYVIERRSFILAE